MASVITRSLHPDALWPGVLAWFGAEYNKFPTVYTQIFEKVKGSLATERLAEATGFGQAQVKTEGAAISYDQDREGYVNLFTPVVYGLGYQVTREEMEDDQYEQVSKKRSANLAFSMNNTIEQVHANMLLNGFNTNVTYGDGSTLFSLTHSTLSGPQANRPVAGTDFSEAALEDMVTQIFQTENSRGLNINIQPKKLILSASNMFNAERILNSKLRTGTNQNDINAINAMGVISEGAIVSPFLQNDDAWYLTTNAPEGLQTIWRREVQLEKDNDFDTENAKAKATARFVPAFGDWRAVFGNPGA